MELITSQLNWRTQIQREIRCRLASLPFITINNQQQQHTTATNAILQQQQHH